MTFEAVRENENFSRKMLLDKLIENKLARRGKRIWKSVKRDFLEDVEERKMCRMIRR